MKIKTVFDKGFMGLGSATETLLVFTPAERKALQKAASIAEQARELLDGLDPEVMANPRLATTLGNIECLAGEVAECDDFRIDRVSHD